MVYGRYNELVNGVYKPTNITGGHHPAWPNDLDKLVFLCHGFSGLWIPGVLTSENDPEKT